MSSTTRPKPTASLYGARSGIWRRLAAIVSDNAAPPKAPAMIPISVMPSCTVDRKRVGALARVRAARAPASPASARFAGRDHGHLGHREHAVGQHEEQNDEQVH